MEIIKVAFRNIFRNPRRTLLTLIASTIGITLGIIATSYFGGVRTILQDEGVKISGHVRITDKKYDIKEKMLDISSNIDYTKVKSIVSKQKNLKYSEGKIKFGGIVYKGEEEKEAMGFAIEESEKNISKIDTCIYQGRFLDYSKTNEIIIGEKIQKILKLNIGDEVTIMTKTKDNSMSAYNYKVVGFFKMDNGKLNQSFYITLKDGWILLDMEGLVTEFVVFLNNIDYAKQAKAELKRQLPDNHFIVKSWTEIGLNGTISQLIPIIEKIIISLLALLAGIGILNTMLMVINERRREMGVLKAMGMKNSEIGAMFCLEGVFIGTIGSSLGVILGSSVAFFLSQRGVTLGKSVQGLPAGVTLTTTIYPIVNVYTILFAFIIGVLISFLATLIPVVSGVKKPSAELIRE